MSNIPQVGGNHYQDCAIQPWEYIVKNNLGWSEGEVVKYVSRWKKKNGVQDLEKARHFLDKYIELQYEIAAAGVPESDSLWQINEKGDMEKKAVCHSPGPITYAEKLAAREGEPTSAYVNQDR
jgi:hypothetical protein